jgi:hypothetical protein
LNWPKFVQRPQDIQLHIIVVSMILPLDSTDFVLVSIAVFFLAIIPLFWRIRRMGQRPSDNPLGPPTLPLIGNLHQIPSEKRHIQFQKWAQEYGPVYSLMLGNKVMIVLSSDVAIKDLVDKRGAIYSSRPEAYIAQTILSGGLRPLFMVCLVYVAPSMS